MVVGNVVDLMR